MKNINQYTQQQTNQSPIKPRTSKAVEKFYKILAWEIERSNLYVNISIIINRYIIQLSYNKMTMDEFDTICKSSIANYDESFRNLVIKVVTKFKNYRRTKKCSYEDFMEGINYVIDAEHKMNKMKAEIETLVTWMKNNNILDTYKNLEDTFHYLTDESKSLYVFVYLDDVVKSFKIWPTDEDSTPLAFVSNTELFYRINRVLKTIERKFDENNLIIKDTITKILLGDEQSLIKMQQESVEREIADLITKQDLHNDFFDHAQIDEHIEQEDAEIIQAVIERVIIRLKNEINTDKDLAYNAFDSYTVRGKLITFVFKDKIDEHWNTLKLSRTEKRQIRNTIEKLDVKKYIKEIEKYSWYKIQFDFPNV